MLFKVTQRDIFEDNPELAYNEVFSSLASKDLKYVFLAYDYLSPLRQMPIEQRKEKAAMDAGHAMEADGKRLNRRARDIVAGNKLKVQKAIEEFNTIQYDSDRELALSVASQIKQLQVFFSKEQKSAAELEKAMKMIKDMPEIVKKQKELEEVLKLREEVEAVEVKLSTIDQYHNKQE